MPSRTVLSTSCGGLIAFAADIFKPVLVRRPGLDVAGVADCYTETGMEIGLSCSEAKAGQALEQTSCLLLLRMAVEVIKAEVLAPVACLRCDKRRSGSKQPRRRRPSWFASPVLFCCVVGRFRFVATMELGRSGSIVSPRLVIEIGPAAHPWMA